MPPNTVFQSTPPVKAATDRLVTYFDTEVKFQSTPPVKAATLNRHFSEAERDISIHAAREGGDFLRQNIVCNFVGISIHAAREGGDLDNFPLGD